MICFYSSLEINQNKSDDEKISFLSLNKVNKNFSYYFDIFQFVKEKYFFVLLVIFIMYIFGASWAIDHYGGITQLKIVSIIFFVDILSMFLKKRNQRQNRLNTIFLVVLNYKKN